MNINDYVFVTNEKSVLYRRRCIIKEITADGRYVVYSEGLEEDDLLCACDVEKSEW